jgi:subfamily B ATP-binding cassette protein MsbA
LASSRVLAEKTFGAKLHEVLTGFIIVKVFNKEHDEVTIFKSNSDRELNLKWASLKWEALLAPIYEVSSTTTFLIIAVLISKLTIIEQVGAAQLFVYFYVVQQFIPTFQRFQNYRIEFGKSSSWNDELKLVIDEIERYQVIEGERILKGFEKSIKFEKLNFSYVPDKPVLKAISCEIAKGKHVALVGPTGAGKTTMVNLVLRLYDCPAGTVLVDGHDIRDYKIASLRDQMAFVSQDIFLFDASVRYNLTYGVSDSVSEARLMEVAQKSSVQAFVKDFAEQYETVIGERGVKLSGGQRQRVALARALLRDAEIFLFDEPTSALDILTEREVVSSIQDILKGKTVVTIAHRLSTVQNADVVIFIHQGQIVAQGTFSELLANNSFFCEFVGSEFKKSA